MLKAMHDRTATGPSIDLWYGPNQSVGERGLAQRWFNVLGRVSHAAEVETFEGQLDSQTPVPLTLGPDEHRLVAAGDFNMDIDLFGLSTGKHRVRLKARYTDGSQAAEALNFTVGEQDPAAPNLDVDWQTYGLPNAHAQVVDGRWDVNGRYVTTREIGYDRLIAIGDVRWRDYEVRVPIVVHAIEPRAYSSPSVHTGVGIVLRWKGHSRWPPRARATGQPRYGPVPYGTIAWWTTWPDERGECLNFFDVDLKPIAATPRRLSTNVPYVFCAQASTDPCGRSLFRLKVWPEADSEPHGWDITTPAPPNALESGSVVLAAHETAASFGPVSIRPVRSQSV